ncbi:adenine deaminase C-terminal domain-containing protein [Sporolactobacillus putidus]|uniref:adenine deaminase n=1 Tax=Sporolactobacillus putidus TaxID=492735 RepID=A0A917S6I1_9BACL|nr:adenine deaminase C-terminal domain-containing protein [Sporolactobacillus putidus]GGL60169.1 adenine deaminase [Sporolactobacillus putidus]
MNQEFYWTITQMRKQAAIIRGEEAPGLVLTDALYLNTYLKTWEKANIWIDGDRIIYVGEEVPAKVGRATETIDCKGYTLVPGYIEPHVHPGQLYNPQTLAAYAARFGTTTLICDNAILFKTLSDGDAFRLIDRLEQLPATFYWWCRYDPQSAVIDSPFSDERIRRWLNHPRVVQGGELTGWPRVVHGDDQILSWMRETKLLRKPIETHLPGASERTLTQLKLYGADCDHEAMTGEEAIMRLKLGYTVSLRYSSIRPDLPDILKTMVDKGVHDFDHVCMTLDGATPAFLKDGVVDHLIRIALEQGVPPEDAYMMASSNIAVHYNLADRIGHIAPGRAANINFLPSPSDPRPVAVMAKGRLVFRDGKTVDNDFFPFNISLDLKGAAFEFSLRPEQLVPKTTVGLDMVNDAITKPFEQPITAQETQLPHDVLYLTLVDKKGSWIINTYIRGFARSLSGFAGSFSATGDVLLIGRNKEDMVAAFNRMKKIKGGLVIAENGEITGELALPLFGFMSDLPMKRLIQEAGRFENKLRAAGYCFGDPFFSLSFLASTHLPYIRITPKGIVDVMHRKLLAASEPLI